MKNLLACFAIIGFSLSTIASIYQSVKFFEPMSNDPDFNLFEYIILQGFWLSGNVAGVFVAISCLLAAKKSKTTLPPQTSHNNLEPHRGTLILALGILSLPICGIFTGIPAWIMGKNDLKKIKAGQIDPEGEGITKGGMICGIISCVISLISIIGIVLLILLGV